MLKKPQLMIRVFDGMEIRQRTDSFFNATDMLSYYNSENIIQKRFKDFWDNNNTQDFMIALRNELLNGDNCPYLDLYTTTRGRGGATYMHPYLFVKFCFWLSPEFEVKVIKWVYDNLIEFRNEAGDHYKEMCKAIADTYHDWYGKNPDPLIFVKEAHFLNQLVFGNPNGNQRNSATEKQLELMNKLQKINISLIYSNTPKAKRQEKLHEFVMMTKMTE